MSIYLKSKLDASSNSFDIFIKIQLRLKSAVYQMLMIFRFSAEENITSSVYCNGHFIVRILIVLLSFVYYTVQILYSPELDALKKYLEVSYWMLRMRFLCYEILEMIFINSVSKTEVE